MSIGGPREDSRSGAVTSDQAASANGVDAIRDRATAATQARRTGEHLPPPSAPPSVSSPRMVPAYALLARVIPEWALTTAGPSGWLGLALAITGSVMIRGADMIGTLLVALAVLFGGYAMWIAGMIFMIKALLRNRHKWLAGFLSIALVVGLLRFLLLLVTALSS